LLHTQEVAGSNPASRIPSHFLLKLESNSGIERSPQRQVRSLTLTRAPLFLFAYEGNNLQK
jgi:hypothetical protein